MDFELTEEQQLLKTNAREFMEKEIIPFVDDYEREYRPLPKDLAIKMMKKLAPLGYIGGLIPQEAGGGDGLCLLWHSDRGVSSCLGKFIYYGGGESRQ